MVYVKQCFPQEFSVKWNFYQDLLPRYWKFLEIYTLKFMGGWGGDVVFLCGVEGGGGNF